MSGPSRQRAYVGRTKLVDEQGEQSREVLLAARGSDEHRWEELRDNLCIYHDTSGHEILKSRATYNYIFGRVCVMRHIVLVGYSTIMPASPFIHTNSSIYSQLMSDAFWCLSTGAASTRYYSDVGRGLKGVCRTVLGSPLP